MCTHAVVVRTIQRNNATEYAATRFGESITPCLVIHRFMRLPVVRFQSDMLYMAIVTELVRQFSICLRRARMERGFRLCIMFTTTARYRCAKLACMKLVCVIALHFDQAWLSLCGKVHQLSGLARNISSPAELFSRSGVTSASRSPMSSVHSQGPVFAIKAPS